MAQMAQMAIANNIKWLSITLPWHPDGFLAQGIFKPGKIFSGHKNPAFAGMPFFLQTQRRRYLTCGFSGDMKSLVKAFIRFFRQPGTDIRIIFYRQIPEITLIPAGPLKTTFPLGIP